MKNYWFTIASGAKYRKHAAVLAQSLNILGIDIDILGSDSMTREESKLMKIDGIMNAPVNFDRIIFLDADTIVLNTKGIDTVNGAWKIPWQIPVESVIPKTLNPSDFTPRLEDFYLENGLNIFARGGIYEGVEWNSGVIIGDRKVMTELAEEWLNWWHKINMLFEGHFRRDQVSFRIAYYNIFKSKYKIADLPGKYNWVSSYQGINPNANILHRTMVKHVEWLERDWDDIVKKILTGEDITTNNRLFDNEAVQKSLPCLKECNHVNQAITLSCIKKAVKFFNPKRILIFGPPDVNHDLICKMNIFFNRIICTDAVISEPGINKDDFIVFDLYDLSKVESFLESMDKDAVCFLTRAHNLEFYRLLFKFKFVRFIEYSFVIFSDSPVITTWDFQDSRKTL
jgi:hypothetical protein